MKTRIIVLLLCLTSLTFLSKGQNTEIDSVRHLLLGTWRWDTYKGGIAGLPPTVAPFNFFISFHEDTFDIANEQVTYYIHTDTSFIDLGKADIDTNTNITWFSRYFLTPDVIANTFSLFPDSTPVDFVPYGDTIDFTHQRIADDFIYQFVRDTISSLFVHTGTADIASPPGPVPWYELYSSINGSLLHRWVCGGSGFLNGLTFAIFDSSSCTPWVSQYSDVIIDQISGYQINALYKNIHCAPQDIEAFLFPTSNISWAIWQQRIIDFINMIPDGDLILIYTVNQAGYSNWSQDLINSFVSLGSNAVNTLVNGSDNAPWIFYGRKGNPASAMEVSGTSINDTLSFFTTNFCDIGIIHSNSSLVWPGDADNNGIANNQDILALGLAFGSTGTTRTNASLSWVGQPSGDWNDTIPGGTDKKHCDTDGDGTVDHGDTLAILLNYGLTHNKTNKNGNRFTDPPLYLEILNDTLAPGDTLKALIKLGDMINLATDIYGLAFSINYTPDYVNDTSIRVDFSNSWLAPTNQKISLVKDLAANDRIDIGYCRINHTAVSGYGAIGKVSYVVIDNVDGKNTINVNHILDISGIKVIRSSGAVTPVFAYGDTVVLKNISSGINNPVNPNDDISIYPNPASHYLTVKYNNGIQVYRIRILNYLGQTLESLSKNDDSIDITNYKEGIYFINIETNKGTAVKRFFVAD